MRGAQGAGGGEESLFVKNLNLNGGESGVMKNLAGSQKRFLLSLNSAKWDGNYEADKFLTEVFVSHRRVSFSKGVSRNAKDTSIVKADMQKNN